MNPDIEALLDQKPIRNVQRIAFAVVTAAIVLEGFDLQLIAFAAPAIAAQWGIARSGMAQVMAAALVGMAVGSAFGGWFGDRWGRRPALIGTVSFFGLATALIALATDIWQVTLLRALAGIAFGAALPNATALTAEWMPPRLRGRAIGIVVIGVPAGGMLGAAICSWLIPAFGWRAAFLVGGALPLSLALIMLGVLPESLRYLLERRPGARSIARLVQRLGVPRQMPTAASHGAAAKVEETHPQEGPGALFDVRYRRTNAGLWLAFFANLCVAFAFFSWIPTLLSDLGLSTGLAIRGSFYFNLFGILGTVIATWVVSSIGSRAVLLSAASLGACAAIGLAIGLTGVQSLSEVWPVMAGLSLVGAALSGGQAVLYAVAANAYATSCRASGIGWAAASGRVGGIVSAFGGGYVLSIGSTTPFLLMASALLVLAGVGTLIVDRHILRKRASMPPTSTKAPLCEESASEPL